MDGLTAKVFRTYNASRTLQEQLDLLTDRKIFFSSSFRSCLWTCKLIDIVIQVQVRVNILLLGVSIALTVS